MITLIIVIVIIFGDLERYCKCAEKVQIFTDHYVSVFRVLKNASAYEYAYERECVVKFCLRSATKTSKYIIRKMYYLLFV